MSTTTAEPTLHDRLAEPFPANVLGWKAQSVKNNRALAVAYIESRDVMNRLDRVVGPENWWADFTPAGDGNVVCRLTLRIGDREVTKVDVGGESDQPDGGDKAKAAFSDAIKRAAVHWGIGRYLYYLPRTWCDYDPAKKEITSPPTLPHWALPHDAAPKPAPAAARTTAPPTAPAAERTTRRGPDDAAPTAAEVAAASTPGPSIFDPLNRKADMDALLTAAGKTWPAALKWLSSQPDVGGKYTDPNQWEQIPEADRKKLVAAMTAKKG